MAARRLSLLLQHLSTSPFPQNPQTQLTKPNPPPPKQVRETSRSALFGRGMAPKLKTNDAVKKDFSDIVLPEGLHNQVGGGLDWTVGGGGEALDRTAGAELPAACRNPWSRRKQLWREHACSRHSRPPTDRRIHVSTRPKIYAPHPPHQVRSLAATAANTKRHGAPFRHMLFYGPPGTGKTLVAKRLARTSG